MMFSAYPTVKKDGGLVRHNILIPESWATIDLSYIIHPTVAVSPHPLRGWLTWGSSDVCSGNAS